MKYKRYIPILLFLALALPRLGDVMGQDEISHYYKLMRLMWENGYSTPEELITFSPHGYALVAVAFCKLCFHFSPLFVRLAGIVMWCITCAIVAKKCKAWLLVTLPVVCQAAVIVEIDQTILPLACLLMVMAFHRYLEDGTKAHFWLAATALGCALWCRLTTPVLLCAPILLYTLLLRQRFVKMCLVMLTGGILFLCTWYFYCLVTSVHFAGPFEYLVISFSETTTGARHSSASSVVQTILYLCFWGFNPFFALLFLLDGIRRFKNMREKKWKMEEHDLYWLCAASLLVGYLFVGGALFGFPKYHCPAFPFIVMAVSEYCEDVKLDNKSKLYYSGLVIGISLAFFFLSNDALFAMRYSIRKLAFDNNFVQKDAIFQLLPTLVAYIMIAAMVTAAGRRLPVAHVLAAAALAVNIAFAVKQSTARYSTGYIYGDMGECKALAQLLGELEEKRLAVPVEIVHFMGEYDTAGWRPQDAPDAEKVVELLEAESPRCFAYSILISPLPFLKELRSSEKLQDILAECYVPYRRKHLYYWLRKDISASPEQ